MLSLGLYKMKIRNEGEVGFFYCSCPCLQRMKNGVNKVTNHEKTKNRRMPQTLVSLFIQCKWKEPYLMALKWGPPCHQINGMKLIRLPCWLYGV